MQRDLRVRYEAIEEANRCAVNSINILLRLSSLFNRFFFSSQFTRHDLCVYLVDFIIFDSVVLVCWPFFFLFGCDSNFTLAEYRANGFHTVKPEYGREENGRVAIA